MKSKKYQVPRCEDMEKKRHRFPNPKTSMDMYKQWIKNVGIDKLGSLIPDQVYKNYQICDNHFEQKYFVPGTLRGLHKHAVPTLHLPGNRHLKTQDTNKINEICPATINVRQRFDDGICEMEGQDLYLDHQNELGHLYLNRTKRKKISAKIALDDILDDGRNSICDKTLFKQKDGNEDDILIIVENSTHDEMQLISKVVSSEALSSNCLEVEKLKLKESLRKLINRVDSMTLKAELDAVKNCIATIINSTLNSLHT